MTPEPRETGSPSAAQGPSPTLVGVFALAAGALVANLYYAQPLVASIAPELGIDADLAGSVVSVTQVGYGCGLFLLVSLADLVENRRLALIMVAVTAAALVGMATATSAVPFFLSAFVIGLCSTGAQVLIPLLAHLVPVDRRGRVVGNVMAGLLTGIMLARPASLFIATSFGWRAVFWCSAALMVVIGLILARAMPAHRPAGGRHYGHILASMAGLLRDFPALRWRAAFQALLFGAFNMFWTAVPLMLAARFGLDGHAIGLFALAGVGGALAAPFAGRLADRGHGEITTAGAMAALAVAFLATDWAAAMLALGLMTVLAIVIDAAVQANQVVSQRIIFTAPAEVRGRVNALYMTIAFAGGALGSVLGTVTWFRGGWAATAIVGALAGGLGLVLFAIQRHGQGAVALDGR